MKKIFLFLSILLAGLAACKKDDAPSANENNLVSLIKSAEGLIQQAQEGTELGMTAPGSKQALQDRVDWANFILKGSRNDTAYNNADIALQAAIDLFNNNKVKAGIPQFADGAYFNLGQVKDLLPDMGVFTIECKVKLADLLTDGTAGLGSFITADDGDAGILLRYTQSGNVEAYVNNGDWFGTSSGDALKINTWYHITFTFDGNTVKIYFDGKEEASVTSASKLVLSIVNTSPFFMGMSRNFQFSSSDHRSMHGNIRDVRFWKKALTPQEIITYKDAALTGQEDGLVAYWPFDLNLGSQVLDKTQKFTASGTSVVWE